MLQNHSEHTPPVPLKRPRSRTTSATAVTKTKRKAPKPLPHSAFRLQKILADGYTTVAQPQGWSLTVSNNDTKPCFLIQDGPRKSVISTLQMFTVGGEQYFLSPSVLTVHTLVDCVVQRPFFSDIWAVLCDVWHSRKIYVCIPYVLVFIAWVSFFQWHCGVVPNVESRVLIEKPPMKYKKALFTLEKAIADQKYTVPAPIQAVVPATLTVVSHEVSLPKILKKSESLPASLKKTNRPRKIKRAKKTSLSEDTQFFLHLHDKAIQDKKWRPAQEVDVQE